MAEALALIGFVSSVAQLVSYGGLIIKRLNEFDDTVKGLPESFSKIRIQLPLLLKVIDHLQDEASERILDPETESLLLPVLEGLRKEIEHFDNALLKILPSPQASQREKISKAIKSVGIQKRLDEFRSSIQYYLDTLSAVQDMRHGKSLRKLLEITKGRYTESLKAGPVEYTKPVWMVKYDLEEDFVGRDDIMHTINAQIHEKNHRVALAGIGGVGKSRIAIQYCYWYQKENPEAHVLWVHGGSRSRFETDYRKIARLLDLPGRQDPDADILRLVADCLGGGANGSWLMVLDNADDRDIWLGPVQRSRQVDTPSIPLIDYLPRCNEGHLLVTTRDRQLGHKLGESRHQPLVVPRLGPREARVLLSSKLPGEETLDPADANELTKALEYLPLTITQAAAYLEQTEITASEYLGIFRAGQSDIPTLLEESLDDPIRDREGSNSVFQTWRISFEQIEKQSPKAAHVLSLMAVLDRQAISRGLLRALDHNDMDHKVAIAKLKAFSLIQEEDSSAKYTLHRLVQLSTQRWLAGRGRLSLWQQTAVIAVAREYPDSVTFEAWPLIQDLGPHVQTVLTYDLTERQALLHRAQILHCLGHYSMEQGQSKAALHMLVESHALRDEHLGKEEELTLESLGLVGLAYSRLNKVKQSHEILIRFHDSAKRTLGPRHRLTLKGMSRLAVTYNKQDHLEEGKNLLLEVLSLTEETFGTTSEDAIRLLTNLAYSYNRLGQWKKAEDVALRALKLRVEYQGEDHPDTLTIMGSLAWTFRAQFRFREAEELEGRALKRRMEVLGIDHPKTQRTMANEAELLGLLGRWEEAEEVQLQVVEGKQRIDGAQHSGTRRAETYLAKIHWVLNNPQDGLAVQKYLTKNNGEGPRGRNLERDQRLKGQRKQCSTWSRNDRLQDHTSKGSGVKSTTQGQQVQNKAYVDARKKREVLQEIESQISSLNQDLCRHRESTAWDLNPTEIQFLKIDFMEQLGKRLAVAHADYRLAGPKCWE